MGKRVLVVLGHPAQDSLCADLAHAYAQAAQQQGHEVRWLRLGQMAFDPVLHQGYREVQPLEPDLQAAQQALQWAQHMLWVYPVWWGSVPALLKGFLDRVFLPGFAFRFRDGKPLPDKLLAGRSADLLVSMDTPPWYFRWVYRMPAIAQMRRPTLELCGIRVRKTLALGPVVSSTPAQRERWLRQAGALARGV
ncbi:MAG: NAD(P)H-dependent oxidoreductase [Rhodoferax sp.]